MFSGAAHDHTIVFVSTDGDPNGALGARDFLDRHRDLPVIAVVALRRIAGRDPHALTLNGWSARPLLAPALAVVARAGGGPLGRRARHALCRR